MLMAEHQAQLDAVKIDPQHYTAEVDNERVRALRIRYGPREKSVMHSHPDAVAILLTAAHIRFTFPDGTTQEIQGQPGQVLWTDAGPHLPENLTDTPFEVILVELKR
jgi:quercetin dioxygenase-like cupin family protein